MTTDRGPILGLVTCPVCEGAKRWHSEIRGESSRGDPVIGTTCRTQGCPNRTSVCVYCRGEGVVRPTWLNL